MMLSKLRGGPEAATKVLTTPATLAGSTAAGVRGVPEVPPAAFLFGPRA